MIVYISMLAISILFAFFATKSETKKEKILFATLSTLPFIIVSTFRYNIGTDYLHRYLPNYLVFTHGGFIDSLEPLFIVLIEMCVFFTKDYVALFVVTSIIINVLVMIPIFKHSKNPIMSISIFFIGSFYFQSLNLVRQYIAMVVLFAGYYMLFNKKSKYLYIILVGIATLFHSMSAVFLIVLFLEKKEIKAKYFLILIAFILVLGGYLGNIADFVVTNTPLNEVTNIAKYVKYFKMGGDLSLSAIIVETAVYIYIYMMFQKLKEKNEEIEKEAIFFVNMQTMTLLCTIMNIHFNLFFRIALLFSIFQIISIPYFWFKNKGENLKIFKYTIENGVMIFTVMVLSVMSARMIFSNVIKGADEVLPYVTIFYEKRIDDAVRKYTDYTIHPRRANSKRWTREFYIKHV